MAEQEDRILGYFLEEASEHLRTIEQGLRKLPETAKQPSAIRELFRAAHSIKGSAAMLGLQDARQVADCFEANFKLLKDNPQIDIDSQLQSLFIGSFGFLQASIQAIRNASDPYHRDPDAPEPIGDPVFAELRAYLQQLLAAAEPADRIEAAAITAERDPAIAQVFGEYVKRKLDEFLDLCLQSDREDTRAQMQQICQKVGKLGENFEFLEWTNLLSACRLAIANPANSLPQLGETIGMALKQAQVLVLADRAQEIQIPADLEAAIAPHSRANLDSIAASTAAGSAEGTTWSLDRSATPMPTTSTLANLPDLVSLDATTAPISADADFDIDAMELNEFMNLLGDDMPTEGTWMTEEDFFEPAATQTTTAATTAPLAKSDPDPRGTERELVPAMSAEGGNAASENDWDFLELWPETFADNQSLPLYSDLDLVSPTERQLSPDLAIATELGTLPAPDFDLDRPMSDLFPAEALDISDTQVPSSGEDVDLNSFLQGSPDLPANDFQPDFPATLAQPAPSAIELEAFARPDNTVVSVELTASDRDDNADFSLELFGDLELPTTDDDGEGSVFNSITLSSSLDFESELSDGIDDLARPASDSLHFEPIGREIEIERSVAVPDAGAFPANEAAASLDDLFGDSFAEGELPATAAPMPDSTANIGMFSNNDLSDLDLSPLQAEDSVSFSNLEVDPQFADFNDVAIEGGAEFADAAGNMFVSMDIDFLADLEPAGNFGTDLDVFSELNTAATAVDLPAPSPEAAATPAEEIAPVADDADASIADRFEFGVSPVPELADLDNLGFDLNLSAAVSDDPTASTANAAVDNLNFDGFELDLPAGVEAEPISTDLGGDLDAEGTAMMADLDELDAEGTAMMADLDELDAEGTAMMEDFDPLSIDRQAIDAAGLNLADLAAAQPAELPELGNISMAANFDNLSDLPSLENLDTNLDHLADLPALDNLSADSIALAADFASGSLDANLDDLLLGDAPNAELPNLDGLDALIGTTAPTDNLGDLDALLGSPAATPAAAPPPTKPSSQRKPKEARKFDQTMKVSVKHLDNLNNLVGELVVNRNTLEQDQNRMRQFVEKLLSEVQKLNEVGKRMQDLYERSLMENSLIASRQQAKPAAAPIANPAPISNSEELGNSGSSIEYDPLEMDRFTPIHLLSQKMIELTVRVRESTADIEFVVDGSTEVTRTLRQITSQLQEDLSKSRMLPFAQTADRLQRGVRDNGLRYGKQVELEIDGRDTPIDKVILESLADPLSHMANNAIAHGIEDPDTRIALGKPPEGKITLRAIHQGNQTIISMSDDGAGIDTDRVKQKALEKGIITAQEAASMSKAEVYDLLFLPSFSTKDQADDLAGRGVGMDVVRTSINEIRGTIATESQLGVGTTFTIRLPLALSIAKALIAVDNKISIAFPMDGIEDTQDISPEQIQVDSEGRRCIFWRDELMPFTPLSELLEYNRPLPRNNFYGGNEEDNDLISILILRTDGQFTAVQVDKLSGDREIVIKPLQGPAAKPLGIAGATVLGDGRIVPIADVMELIALAKGTLVRQVWAQGTDKMVAPTEELRESSVLIVDDSITVRELLSLTFKRAGYRVEQARDGQEAWDKLRAGLPCDIVFCDIEMPRMDGLEFLSRIQKDPSLSSLPVAMLTSRGSDRHRQIASQLGASGYFIKPYLEEALLDAAKRMIGGEVLEIV